MAGPDLVTRMKELGVVAAVQPSFVPSDAATVMKRLRCAFRCIYLTCRLISDTRYISLR